jgi:site-specific DNA-methyltransferase (adenine-specific)
MDYMAGMADNAFDLAIVDPPYGIGNFIPQTGKKAAGNFNPVTWNGDIPPPEYFAELRRVSVNHIVWGANYYNCFPRSGGSIIWDKMQLNPRLSRCEIASTTIGKRVAYFQCAWAGFLGAESRAGIHPCEKPVALYRWILKNYAKPGQRILDTHLGSGSIAIACDMEGFDLVGCEIDADYIKAARHRLAVHQSAPSLFQQTNVPAPQQM